MADLAIGISKTAIEELVNKVESAIKEEAEQWQIVQHDLVFITDEFEMMQSFLNSTDRKHVKTTVVRTWVSQIRDLSYDAEDCIEFILHLDTNKSSVWLRLLPFFCRCCKQGVDLPLDQAVTEIKQLKKRVEDVSQRNIRYRLIGDSGSESLTQQRFASGSASGAPGFDILAEARDTTAMAGGSVDLTKLINEESNALQVISVWGTGDDLETLSIIRNMYEYPRIQEDFKHRAWVKVMDPVNPHEFIRSMVVQFYTNSWRQEHGATAVAIDALSWTQSSTGRIVKKFVQQVNKDRYLIILEGLSSMVQWDNIKPYLPDKKNGSRIVVSTRHYEIASMCTGKPHRVLELQRSSPDHSICIFFNEGFESAERGIMAGVRRSSQTAKLLGRESEVKKLSSLIENRPDANKPHVVSVWGIPGSGRTAFVRNVYESCKQNFDWGAAFHMPQPYSHPVFCRRLLYSIDPTILDKVEAKEPMEQCLELLRDFPGLVVIDGIQSKGDWDLIKANLIPEQCKSCIVVSATKESVATHCSVDNNLVCSIKCLHAAAALELFKQAYQNNGDLTLLGGDNNVKAILSKSGGLPQVIVAVGRYLARQHADIRKSMCLRLTANFMHELETKSELAGLRGLVAWMGSYLWSCSPSLMRCMLYLSIFPRGQTFRWRRLLRRWIAEGYVRGVDSNTLEESAGEIFNKLASQSVVQQATPTTMEVWYEVNGFFHEFMISRPLEEKSLFPLQVSVLDERHGGVTIEGVGQHLSIMENWVRNKIVFDSLDFSRLRSLTVFGKWEPYFVSDKMRVLRVLDIQDSKGGLKSSALDKMLQLLPRLKFLSLRGCGNISSLPDSLGGLSQLQTLDIRHTGVVKLPASIIKLRKLQYIRSGNTLQWKHEEEPTPPRSFQSTLSPFLPKFCNHGTPNGGVEVPRGMKNLTALHTLGVVNASAAGGKAILKELRKLTQLRKLGVSGINLENIKHLSLALVSDLQSLSLHIQMGNTAASASVGEIQFPPKLRSLKLHGSVENKLLSSIGKLKDLSKLSLEVEKLPPSIGDLKDLTKLSLDLNTSKRGDIKVLGKLEKLHTLRLRIRKVQDDELRFCDGQDDANPSTPTLFLKLEVLDIACTKSLHVRFGKGAMEKLVLLAVSCYRRPLLHFSGLEHVVSLNQVLLRGSYDDILVTILSQQLDVHPNKPILNKLQK